MRDNIQKKRKAYSKGGLVFRANRGKGLLAEKLTKDYFHLERHGHSLLQDKGKKLQRGQVKPTVSPNN